MADQFIGWIQRAIFWVSSAPNRERLRGARVEAIAYVIARTPEPSILLVKSAKGAAWMPPQEGIGLTETFHDGLYRCLEDECGVAIPEGTKERSRFIHMRLTKYLGTLDLPLERWNERGVADDASGTALERIDQRKKAYWAVIGIVRDRSVVAPVPDGTEIVEAEWVCLDEARYRITKYNRPEKAALLLKGLDFCNKHI